MLHWLRYHPLSVLETGMGPPRRKASRPPHAARSATPSPFASLVKQCTVANLRKLVLRYSFICLIKAVHHVLYLEFSPSHCWVVALLLLAVEAVLNLLVIHSVRYTEIDWRAYMQEVEGVVNGTWDYSKLRGDTGPLVYPAGFVWLYMGLYYITSHGTNILLAQYIFAGLYLANLALVFRILVRTNLVPPYILVLMSLTSYRVHSIFILRLFNDPVAMLLLYAAINLFMDGLASLGSLVFSLAVSVKMNILLYSPAVLLYYLAVLGLPATMVQLTICATTQLVIAAPFLIQFPVQYIIGAFNLGRIFLFEWTVNFRFLSEAVFVSRWFHITLLALHLLALVVCGKYWWQYLGVYRKLHSIGVPNCEQLLVLPLFMCNFLGVMFARSLHYQAAAELCT